MTILLIAAVLVAIASSHALPHYVTEELTAMVHKVISVHFTMSKCVALITEDNTKLMDDIHPLQIPVLHVNLTLSVIKNSERLPTGFEEYAWDQFLLGPMDAGCLAFVIQTSDVRFMVKTFARLAHSPESVYRANRRFLYLPSKEIPEHIFESIISELYVTREMDFMPDMVIAKVMNSNHVMSNNTENGLLTAGNRAVGRDLKIELITHSFRGPDPSERISLDTWISQEGFLNNADLYPDKVTNLMGKQISLTAIYYPPLSVVDEDVDPPIYDGLEFKIMHEWSKKHNITWRVVYAPDDWWGVIWENGSGVGLCGHVSMDKADVGFGAIYLWENEHRFTDYSAMYFRTALTTVLPRPKLLPGWLVPIHPFQFNMWIAVGLSVFVSTTVLHMTSQGSMKLLGTGRGKTVVNMYSTWTECLFRTMGLLVLQVPPDERDFSTPRHVPMRHLVTWLILFYFVVTTGYSAGLAAVLTMPRYEKPIETATEMSDRNVKYGGMDVAYVFFLQESLDPKMKKLANNFIEGTEEYLTKKATTGEMGFVIERMMNGHFFLPSFVNEDTMPYLRVMKEDYVYGNCVFMLRKGSPYRGIINSIVYKVRDTGLVLFWEDMTVRKYMSTRRQLSVINSRKDVDPGPTQLLIRHVTGSFYLLGYGLALSFLVFIIELLTHNCRLDKLKGVLKKRTSKNINMKHSVMEKERGGEDDI